MKIEVFEGVARSDGVTKEGNPFTTFSQMALLTRDDGQVLQQYPMDVPDENGYPAGLYQLTRRSFRAGNYNKPEFARDFLGTLEPIPTQKAQTPSKVGN